MLSIAFGTAKAIVRLQTKQERFQRPSVSNSSRIIISSSTKQQPEKQSRQRRTKTKLVMMAMENQKTKYRPRILCLHGYRTSAAILQKMLGRWPETVLDKLQLDFLDGPVHARGKSGLEGVFDPPYYEWYHSSEDYKEYRNFEECLAYIEEYMIKHGPFDGLLGFSQGAMIAAVVPGMQAQGVAFTRVPKIKFLIIISGGRFGGYKLGQPKLAANAFSSPIACPSLHIIGETDFLKPRGNDLIQSFVNPVVIRHPRGHSVPKLDGISLNMMLNFIEKIQLISSL